MPDGRDLNELVCPQCRQSFWLRWSDLERINYNAVCPFGCPSTNRGRPKLASPEGVWACGCGRTLADAQADVRAHMREGIICPCCSQNVALRKRALSAPMARYLIAITYAFIEQGGVFGQTWIEVPKLPIWSECTQRGDYSYLRHWDLLRPLANDDPKKRTSGFWQPTWKGVLFMHDRIRVPSHAFTYNKQVYGWSKTDVGIAEALGKHFDYSELVAWNRGWNDDA